MYISNLPNHFPHIQAFRIQFKDTSTTHISDILYVKDFQKSSTSQNPEQQKNLQELETAPISQSPNPSTIQQELKALPTSQKPETLPTNETPPINQPHKKPQVLGETKCVPTLQQHKASQPPEIQPIPPEPDSTTIHQTPVTEEPGTDPLIFEVATITIINFLYPQNLDPLPNLLTRLYYLLTRNSRFDRCDATRTIALWRRDDPDITDEEIERRMQEIVKMEYQRAIEKQREDHEMQRKSWWPGWIIIPLPFEKKIEFQIWYRRWID